MGKLPKKIRTHPFTLAQARSEGLSRYTLNALIANESVELVARGVYRATKSDLSEEDQYRIATLRVGMPSAICLISALSHYDLTDTIPRKTWIMVPVSKRTNYSDIKLLRTRNPEWTIGIEKFDGYSITTIERTIVDALCARTKIGTQIASEALRKAIQSKKTNLGKIMDMAAKLKLAHRIRHYIEILS